MKKILFLTIWIIILITGQSFAATIYVTSCSYADVKTAVDSANAGDTVMVPAGTATWANRLTLSKSVRLIGAGIEKTIIKNGIIDTGGGDFLVNIRPEHPEDDPFIEVTGFTFDADNEGACISVYCRNKDYAYYNFRIHHNKIKNNMDEGDSYMSIKIKGNCFGLIDNNQFENNNYAFKIYGYHGNSWVKYPGLENIGTKNYLYIENNTINNCKFAVLTSGEGARWVFRYNQIHGRVFIDAHGDTRNRGVVANECYENIATNDFNPVTGGSFKYDYRGGTGIIFNNTIQIGTSGTRGSFRVREEHDHCTCQYGCDGSPGGDQVNNGYIWNNINSRSNEIIAVWVSNPSSGTIIEEDRDWWDDAEHSPGGEPSSNFTYDIAANRPSTSLDDDCYWETDTRKLYRSIGDNNWTFIYSPYIYPHPLAVSEVLQTPTGLKILK